MLACFNLQHPKLIFQNSSSYSLKYPRTVDTLHPFLLSVVECKFFRTKSHVLVTDFFFLVAEEGGFSQMKITAICSPSLLVSSLLLSIFKEIATIFWEPKSMPFYNKLITHAMLSLYICVECFE